ncbi:phage tail sheath family protein [Paenibacillus sp. HB172176]|uniref:phage tail sheath family protein n=1 Tax=Paenibacillus sp. HB172176 TaxID=2493690 RepID=UPI001438D905|nr:phage tail sheath family protein [Paenibacillus sp. HB172176]
MAAGTFTTMNKVRPGVYVNFNTEAQPVGAAGERGIVAMPLVMSWGKAKEVVVIEAGEDTYPALGYSLTDPKMLLVRESLKRARTLLLYRLNSGTEATGSDGGNLTITARYGGVRGNDISVVIAENVDNTDHFDVTTLVEGVIVDEQLNVADIAGLSSNAWVTFTGTGALAASAGIPLTGGADGTVTNTDYTDYLTEIEIYDFNTLAYTGTDDTLKGALTSFAQRLRDDEGKKIQVVVENYPSADYEGVISVKNGVVLADGTTLTAAQSVAWVAGATAGAAVNESLTYSAYDGAVDVSPRYTNSQIIAALQAGEFVFTQSNQKALVEQDINTFTGTTPAKGKAFGKNRVIRVLDGMNNDFVRIFSDYYIGKVNNNGEGRNLLKGECINYLDQLQAIEAIQNFDSQSDITVSAIAGESDSIVIHTNIQPVDSMEKIYMQVEIGGAL